MRFYDFVSKKYEGAGFAFITPDEKILMLQKHNNKWSLVGGHSEKKETPLQTAKRETKEEIGFIPSGEIVNMIKYTKKETKGSCFSFIMRVEKPFVPILSSEHVAYKWIPLKEVSSYKLSKAVLDLYPILVKN
jgi:8-oxo-dGTP pyrophosphatase MutT (NUDIX family)